MLRGSLCNDIEFKNLIKSGIFIEFEIFFEGGILAVSFLAVVFCIVEGLSENNKYLVHTDNLSKNWIMGSLYFRIKGFTGVM